MEMTKKETESLMKICEYQILTRANDINGIYTNLLPEDNDKEESMALIEKSIKRWRELRKNLETFI